MRPPKKSGTRVLAVPGVKKVFDGKTWQLLCTVGNCKAYAQKNGQCYRHCYENEETESSTESNDTIDTNRRYNGQNSQQLCSINNCEKLSQLGGLCYRHFRENREEDQSREAIGTIHMNKSYDGCKSQRLCAVNSCQKNAHTNHLCYRHFTEIQHRQEPMETTEKIRMNGKFNDPKRGRGRFCSVNNCTKYAKKKGMCCRHFTEKENQQNSTQNTTIFHQLSTRSTREELNIISHRSTTLNPPTTNHTDHKTFDGYQYTQRTTSEKNSKKQHFEKQSLPVHSPFSCDDDYIVSNDEMDSSMSSLITRSPGISINTSHNTTNKQNKDPNVVRCEYRLSTIDDGQCQNLAMFKCSHCSSSYCLQHDLQHQHDLQEEISYLLDEAQQLITEIPSLNIDSGKRNCIEQFKHWMKMIIDKIKQRYAEFQMELDRLDTYIELNRDQWKRLLSNRVETRVTSVLTKQLQQHTIDRLQVNEAQNELIRVQQLCDLLNSQTLITVSSVEDNQVHVNTPHLMFPSVTVDGLNWIDGFSTDNSDQQIINTNENAIATNTDDSDIIFITTTDPTATDQVKKPKPAGQPAIIIEENRSRMDVGTSKVVPNVINLSVDNMPNLINSSTNIKTERTNPVHPILPLHHYHNSKVEQMISNQKDDLELKLQSGKLIPEDMEILAHYLLVNSKPPVILNLSWNEIGAKGVRHLIPALQWNTTLRMLNLQQNEIKSEGTYYLSSVLLTNTTLTSLHLGWNQISNEGVHHLSIALKSNTTLSVLNLVGNQIGNEGVQYLSEALKLNKTLTMLTLSRNGIGNDGALYLIDALQSNETLIKLAMSWNSISNKLMDELTMALNFNMNRRVAYRNMSS